MAEQHAGELAGERGLRRCAPKPMAAIHGSTWVTAQLLPWPVSEPVAHDRPDGRHEKTPSMKGLRSERCKPAADVRHVIAALLRGALDLVFIVLAAFHAAVSGLFPSTAISGVLPSNLSSGLFLALGMRELLDRS